MFVFYYFISCFVCPCDIEINNLKKPTNNSIDTVSDRDFVLDYLFNVSVCSMHISRVAEELIIWNSDGFKMISLGFDWQFIGI